MKNLPLPPGLPWEIQLLIWVLGILAAGLLAMALWFIVKHINAQEEGFKKVNKRIDDNTADIKHSVDKMTTHAEKMTAEAVKIKQASLDFQIGVNKDLAALEKRSLQIEATLDRTNDKAAALEKKFDVTGRAMLKVAESVDKLQKVVDGHQKSLSLGATAIAKQREEVLGIKTTVTKLSDKVTLIGQKYVPKKNGSDDPTEEGGGQDHKG